MSKSQVFKVSSSVPAICFVFLQSKTIEFDGMMSVVLLSVGQMRIDLVDDKDVVKWSHVIGLDDTFSRQVSIFMLHLIFLVSSTAFSAR